jgi:hypothetical protein
MRLAVMQPYFFPYIGYFQLIDAVEEFVLFDDVNFIKKGWINRNNILLNNSRHMISLPIRKISQNKKIEEHFLQASINWRSKLQKTLHSAYSKAPCYDQVAPLIEQIVSYPTDELSAFLLKETCRYLNIETKISLSSNLNDNKLLKGQDRIIDICILKNASSYYNSIGGKELYSADAFESKGIHLNFVRPNPIEYRQFSGDFLPSLSIIDVMMFNSREKIQSFLTKHEVI